MGLSFKISVKGLIDGIQPANVVATTGVVKGFAGALHVSLEATPDALLANANGGRISVSSPTPYFTTYCTEYQFKSGGSVTVRAADLIAVLSSFKKEEILNVEVVEAAKPELAEDASEDDRAVWEAITGQALRLSPVSDPEQEQTLPILSVTIEVPQPEQKPDSSISVRRSAFVHCLKRVIFAGGFEDRREKFLYWMLRATPKWTRFIAGSGQRFAIDDIHGEGVTDVKDRTDMLVPVEQSQTLLKLFSDSVAENVRIKHYGGKILFEADSLRVLVVGMNPNIQWIDERKILDRTNLYKFIVSVDEWDMAIKGIVATNSDEAKRRDPVHPVIITFDTKKGVATLSSDRGTKKATRKVKLADVWTSGEQPTEVVFKCVVNYLAEVSKHADKSQHVQFELVGSALPMIVRSYAGEKVSHDPMVTATPAAGGDEDFTMLIAKLSETKE